jgi:hypothetical protein
MKALAKAAAKIFKENMMSNRGKGNKDELENKDTHKMSIDTESHDKLKISPIMDKKAMLCETFDLSCDSAFLSMLCETFDLSCDSAFLSMLCETFDLSCDSGFLSMLSETI